MGSLQNRDIVLGALQNLPQASDATDEEVLRFIAHHALFGTGIGYIDAHLLAAVQLSQGALLWTRDKRLQAESVRLGLCANLTHCEARSAVAIQSGLRGNPWTAALRSQ